MSKAQGSKRITRPHNRFEERGDEVKANTHNNRNMFETHNQLEATTQQRP